MILQLLKKDIQEFITLHIGKSISALALQKNPYPELEYATILNQIEAKNKAKNKLPTWFKTPMILYPSKISIEQTSSESTALYKSTLVSGESLIDLTGGFGVDDFYFSKKIKNIVNCEINAELSEIVKHNFKQLDINNVQFFIGDSLTTLTSLQESWDWIYIDPSRRNDAKGKVFMLKDCLPNVPLNLEFYFENANSILIKTAPLLDISAGLKELRNVKIIHIVAIENEVKELIWQLEKDFVEKTTIKTVNLLKDNTDFFEYTLAENRATPSYSLPQKYLYEPNSAILKSGGFDEVAIRFRLNKLHKHSHLYTNFTLISFPGRIFEIETVLRYHKTEMKIYLEGKKANVTTRNFPETVEHIRKKWKIKEGGTVYCFFTIDENDNKIVLICRKI